MVIVVMFIDVNRFMKIDIMKLMSAVNSNRGILQTQKYNLLLMKSCREQHVISVET